MNQTCTTSRRKREEFNGKVNVVCRGGRLMGRDKYWVFLKKN